MTKRKQEARRLAALPPKPASERTPFTAEECLEIREMQRLVNMRKFEAAQVKGNTALVPRGQEVAAELDAIARLVENAKNLWMSQRLLDHGYPHDMKCEVNLTTGEVIVTEEAKQEEPAAPVEAAAPAPTAQKAHATRPKNSPKAA